MTDRDPGPLLPGRPRRPRALYDGGREPDPRFSLANQRTLLAWVRTALGLCAAGVALESVDTPLDPRFRLTASVLLLGLGVLAPAQAWLGWYRAERAMRHRDPLPGPGISLTVVLGTGAAGVLLLVGLVVGLSEGR